MHLNSLHMHIYMHAHTYIHIHIQIRKRSRGDSMLVSEADPTSCATGVLSPVRVSIDASSGAMDTVTTHVNMEKSTVEGNEDKE